MTKNGLLEVPHVDISEWGKDHWTTLAYLETRVVDHKGVVRLAQMRCDADIHPEFAHRPLGEKKYPTRLKMGSNLHNHDDWSCVEDMEREGLLKRSGKTISFTEYGYRVCAALRRHRAKGKRSSLFEYKR